MMQQSYVSRQYAPAVVMAPVPGSLQHGVAVRATLRLWQSNIQPDGPGTRNKSVKEASALTGKTYGKTNKDLEQAIADMDEWVVTTRRQLATKQETRQ